MEIRIASPTHDWRAVKKFLFRVVFHFLPNLTRTGANGIVLASYDLTNPIPDEVVGE